VREEVGFDHTYYLDYAGDARIANGYDESIFNVGRRNVTAFRESLETGAYAAGGILSTAPDVAEFVRALFTSEMLADQTVSRMRTFVDAPDEDVTTQRGYGLGVRKLVIDGRSLVGHTGTIPGYSAIAMHHDDSEYTIAVLSNLSTIDQTRVFGRLQNPVLNGFY
jgi:D-alanyl-D-alanine carboxypeptidase